MKNTHFSCVISSLDLIARIYTEYKEYLTSTDHQQASEGRPNKKIDNSMKLAIPKYVNNKEYQKLDELLGAALPEVNQTRYYDLTKTKKKDELTFKDLRNIITWQLWITNFRDIFPSFRSELLKTLQASQPYGKIKQFIFDKTKTYDELSSNDLGIYSNRERPVKPDNETEKKGKVYQNALRLYERESNCKEQDFQLLGNLNEDDRELWWLRRMLERFATTAKKDVLCYQDIMGQSPSKEIRLPKEVLHLLQFLTYISTNETDTRENMVILNTLKDRTDDNFIATVKNINHISFILSKAHASKVKDFCKTWNDKFLQKHKDKYPNLIWFKKQSLVVKRLDYILRKGYYDQAMKFLKKFGFNPPHATHCIKEHNTILKDTIDKFKSGNFKKETFFDKYMWNDNQANQWDIICIGTTDIFLNFLTWHLEREIEIQKDDNLVAIMDTMMDRMNTEQAKNLVQYKAYMVKEWDIYEIGNKLFGADTNNENNVNICMHMQNHADTKEVTKKKEGKAVKLTKERKRQQKIRTAM